MEMGDEAEQQNKKGGRRVKKKGAKRRRRPETELGEGGKRREGGK